LTLAALPNRNAPTAMVTAWKTSAPASPPKLVNPSAREKTPPITYTIQTRPSTSSRIPTIRDTIFILRLLRSSTERNLPLSQDHFALKDHYNPRALKSSHRVRIAVTPWKVYPASAPPLRPEVLPRITSAITYTIQTAEISQTTTVPIHHHMVASPPCSRSYGNHVLRTIVATQLQNQLFVGQAFPHANHCGVAGG